MGLTEQPMMCLRLGSSCLSVGTTRSNWAEYSDVTKTMASCGCASGPMLAMVACTASATASGTVGSEDRKLPHLKSLDPLLSWPSLTMLPVSC